MKQIIGLMAGCFLAITSCQKMIDSPAQRITGTDSTGKELMMKYVEVWSSADSFITNYTYNSEGSLMEENSQSSFGFTQYFRDGKGRVATTAALAGNNDTAFTDVHYADENSGIIAYTLSHNKKAGSKITDSTVYVYEGGKLSKTMFYTFPADTAWLGNYYTWAYDVKNNISQLINYTRNNNGNYLYNIGYDFMYDDKPNPFYSTDLVRQCTKWYLSSSPNNLVKQINHYGNPPLMPDDYIALMYSYNMAGKPVAATRSGPAIGASVVRSSYYYK